MSNKASHNCFCKHFVIPKMTLPLLIVTKYVNVCCNLNFSISQHGASLTNANSTIIKSR